MGRDGLHGHNSITITCNINTLYFNYSLAQLVPALATGRASSFLLCPLHVSPFVCFLRISLLCGTIRYSRFSQPQPFQGSLVPIIGE